MAQFSYIYGQSAGKAFALRSERQFILMAKDKVEKWSQNKTFKIKKTATEREKKTVLHLPIDLSSPLYSQCNINNNINNSNNNNNNINYFSCLQSPCVNIWGRCPKLLSLWLVGYIVNELRCLNLYGIKRMQYGIICHSDSAKVQIMCICAFVA